MKIPLFLWLLLLCISLSHSREAGADSVPAIQTDRDLGLSTGKGRQDGIINIENARHLAGKYSTGSARSSVRPQRRQVSPANSHFNQPHERFMLDGFEWSILSVHAFSQLGASDNPHYPTNGVFVLVEFEATNTTNKAAFIHSNLVLTADGQQYESSSYSVYAHYQMHYEDGGTVNVEPGITHKTYYVFDAKQHSSYKLIARGFLNDEHIEKQINI